MALSTERLPCALRESRQFTPFESVLEDATPLWRMWRDALDVTMDEEGDVAICLAQETVHGMIIRAPFTADAPNNRRQFTPMHAVAREREGDETLSIAITLARNAAIDREEAGEHALLHWVLINRGKVYVPRTVAVVTIDANQLEVLVTAVTLAPRLPRRLRPCNDHIASSALLHVCAGVHEEMAVV